MIVIANASGQLCNQLVLFAHAYATAIDSGQAAKHIFAYGLNQFFDFDGENYSLILHKDIMRVFRIIDSIKYDYIRKIRLKIIKKDFRTLTDTEKRKKTEVFRKRGFHIITEWDYRDYDALLKKQDRIREVFLPRQHIRKPAEDFISKVKKANEVLIAVHMRRGDYKTWRGGRFYYDNKRYKQWMSEIAECFPGQCSFVLFSNEKIQLEELSDEKYRAFIAEGSAIQDLYTMSLCDYIMGPPSTFSWWAAFQGNKPYCTLYSTKMKLGLEMFQFVKGEEFNPDMYLKS